MIDSDKLRPSSIEGIKRLADRLQTRLDIPRNEALDQAAQRGGFRNFVHATRAITDDDQRALEDARRRRDASRRREEYRADARRRWSEAIEAVATDPLSTVWADPLDIIEALAPFMGEGLNHGFFPTGGGNDFTGVHTSWEPGCVELMVDRLAYVVRPRRLRLERIADDVAESFLFLELDTLAPSGVYERGDEEPMPRRMRESEELVDIGDGQYLERAAWDRGTITEYGEPLPRHARRVHRLLSGSLMFACKAGIWNDISETYMGWHDQLGADGVRAGIEGILVRGRETETQKG